MSQGHPLKYRYYLKGRCYLILVGRKSLDDYSAVLLISWFLIRKAIWYVYNWQILEYSRNLFLFFFQSTKLRQPTEGIDSCLKINEYYIIFVHSTIRQFGTYQITFLMRNQEHKTKWNNIMHLKYRHSKICHRMIFLFSWKDSSDFFGIRTLKIKEKNIAHRGSQGRFLLLPKKEIELDWPPAKISIFVIDFFNLVRWLQAVFNFLQIIKFKIKIRVVGIILATT